MNDQLEELGLEPLVGSDVAMALAGWKSQTTLLTAISDGNFRGQIGLSDASGNGSPQPCASGKAIRLPLPPNTSS